LAVRKEMKYKSRVQLLLSVFLVTGCVNGFGRQRKTHVISSVGGKPFATVSSTVESLKTEIALDKSNMGAIACLNCLDPLATFPQ